MSYPKRKGYPKDYYKPYNTNLFKKHKDAKQDRAISTLRRTVGRPEYKRHGVTDSGTNGLLAEITNTPYIFRLSNIARGTGQGERIGDQISLCGLYYNLIVQDDNHGAAPVRMVIFYDNNYDESVPNTPTYEQLLQVNNVTDTSLTNFVSEFNHDFVKTKFSSGSRKRFEILVDKIIVTNQSSITQNARMLKRTIKFRRPKVLQYNAAVQAGGRSLWCMLIAGKDTTSTDNPGYIFRSTIYYRDL